MGRLSLSAIYVALALLTFLVGTVSALQLSRRVRASRRAGRTLFAPETRRQYRTDENDINNEGRRLTFTLEDSIHGNDNGEDEEPFPDRNLGTDLHVPKFPSRKTNRNKVIVRCLNELRSAVLDHGVPLRNIELDVPQTENILENIFDHEVLNIISKRAIEKSKPGKRAADDNAKLALSIEGGGMRGAVSAGMVAAIACLGLSDCFDTIYGSSAGSIIGAYMISRQMCIDVYTDVLTAAKKEFLRTNKLLSSLVRTFVDTVVRRATFRGVRPNSSHHMVPGLNISFILDGIMCPDFGLRPLDIESFRANDARQPLRVVSSAVRGGKMEVVCFGSNESDFFDDVSSINGTVTSFASTSADGTDHGLFACLAASMKVPAATGPPVSLIRNCDSAENITTTAFDAFCYEPIPYRSAVDEGATHVLALRTRPDGSRLRSKPTLYEKLMAPHYFKSNNLPQVAEFFKRGGQQYIYLEDILTLDNGSSDKSSEGVEVPPPGILYGANPDDIMATYSTDRSTWKKAHLLPVALPHGTRELSCLSQDKDDVLQAIRDGFAVAFDMLAPSAGLDLSKHRHLNGRRVAELIFQDSLGLQGDLISAAATAQSKQIERTKKRKLLRRGLKARLSRRSKLRLDSSVEQPRVNHLFSGGKSQRESRLKCDAKTLLMSLPGIQQGQLSELADGLRYHSGR